MSNQDAFDETDAKVWELIRKQIIYSSGDITALLAEWWLQHVAAEMKAESDSKPAA